VSFTTIEVGQRFTGHGRTLTETDHALFMMLCADWHPIHADQTFAQTTPAGTRLMHGSFGVALALGMVANVLSFKDPVIGALGLREWSFKAPMMIGHTVHVEIEIADKRKSGADRGIVELDVALVAANGQVLQQGRSGLMLAL
jgi:acyl dehydratase